MEDIELRIEQLRKELHQHNHKYHVLDQPTVSDYEFDQLLKKLEILETQFPQYFDSNSPTQRIFSGSPVFHLVSFCGLLTFFLLRERCPHILLLHNRKPPVLQERTKT